MCKWRAAVRAVVAAILLAGGVACSPETRKPEYVPRTSAMRALEAATTALAGGDLARARAKVEEALAEDPDYFLSHGVYGMVLVKAGELYAALAEMDQAVALNPDYGEGHLMRGVFLEQTGDRPAADSAYDMAVQAFDRVEDADRLQRVHRAVALYLRDGMSEGIVAIDQVVRDHPNLQTAATVRQKMIGEDREFFLRWAASADRDENGS